VRSGWSRASGSHGLFGAARGRRAALSTVARRGFCSVRSLLLRLTNTTLHVTHRGVHGNENRKIDCLNAVCDIKSIHESHCTLGLR